MYKILLIIGISLLLFSCQTTDNIKISNYTYYTYTNNTNQDIELKVYSVISGNTETFILSPNQSKIFQGSCGDSAGGGICPSFLSDNTFSVKFINDLKCLTNYHAMQELNNFDNYTIEMTYNSNNNLIYLIDQEELDAATPCN